MRITVSRERVDPWATGVPESQQLCHLVKRFAGRVINRVSNYAVLPLIAPVRGQVQVRVPARNDQRQRRCLQAGSLCVRVLQQHRMNVSFQVVYCNQRLAKRPGQGLCIRHPDQKRPGQPRSFCYRYCVQSVAARTTGTMFFRCSREASSGTTPP